MTNSPPGMRKKPTPVAASFTQAVRPPVDGGPLTGAHAQSAPSKPHQSIARRLRHLTIVRSPLL
jgi:hypothetical protein